MAAAQPDQRVTYLYPTFFKNFDHFNPGDPVPKYSVNCFFTLDALLKENDNFSKAKPPLGLHSLSWNVEYSGGGCFLAVFAEQNPGRFFYNNDWDVFEDDLNQGLNDGTHLADIAIRWGSDTASIDVFNSTGPTYFSVWDEWGDQTPVKQSVLRGDIGDWDDFATQVSNKAQAGEKLVKIRAYPSGGSLRLLGIFEQSEWQSASLVRYTPDQWYSTGFHQGLVDIQVVDINGVRSFICVIDQANLDNFPLTFMGTME